MKNTYATLSLVCFLTAGACLVMFTFQDGPFAYLISSLILGACSLAAFVLARGAGGKTEKGWFVLTPGMDKESGPYHIKTLGQMWRRGQMPPGTQVARQGKEWKDVALMVNRLDAASDSLNAVGVIGGILMAIGLILVVTVHALIGGVLAGVGILIVIASK
jgi:hypothetical protein